jgi:hypothetical protein
MCALRLKSSVPKIAILFSLLIVGILAFGQGNTSVLTGTVTDQSLAPVTGVSVTLSSLDRVYQTKSASDGGSVFWMYREARMISNSLLKGSLSRIFRSTFHAKLLNRSLSFLTSAASRTRTTVVLIRPSPMTLT